MTDEQLDWFEADAQMLDDDARLRLIAALRSAREENAKLRKVAQSAQRWSQTGAEVFWTELRDALKAAGYDD